MKSKWRSTAFLFLGLITAAPWSDLVSAQIATRKVETKIKFWNVKPRLDLLTNRHPDEAYVATDPGNAYILYFTRNGGGTVGLKLDKYPDTLFELTWVNVGTGNWGPTETLSGGSTIRIDRPNDSSHWVATIVRRHWRRS